MPNKISIPKPCHQDWNSFTQAEQGRHCQVCAKTVIDFTTWQPNAIANYLSNKAEGETCGRFTKAQLAEPIPTAAEFTKQISYFRISTLKKIAAIFLFAFVIENNSYASNEIVHGGISAVPPFLIKNIPIAKFGLSKTTLKKLSIKKKTKKAKFKKAKHIKKKIKFTKGNVICTKPLVNNNEIIMGKMIAMPVEQHLMGDTAISRR